MYFGKGTIGRALPGLLAALIVVLSLAPHMAAAESAAPGSVPGPTSVPEEMATALFLNSHEVEQLQPGDVVRYQFMPTDEDQYIFMSFPTGEGQLPAVQVRLLRLSDGEVLAETQSEGMFRLNADLSAGEACELVIECKSAGSMAVEVMMEARGRCFDDAIQLPEGSIRYAKTIVHPRDTHWFTFVAPADGWYSIRTEKSGSVILDTRGYLLDEAGRTIAASDDILFPGDANFMLNAQLTAGQTYYVRISAFSNLTGPYRLVLTVPEEGQVLPEEISLSRHDLMLDVEEEYRLSAQLQPNNALSDLVYASSDQSVITVEPDGTVRAVAAGEATVWAFAYGAVQDSCRVTVRPVEVTGMSLPEDEVSLRIGDRLTLAPVFEPANASRQTARYESSDEAVVTVSESGQLTGMATGTAVITAISTDGSFADTVIVHVLDVRPVYRALVLGETDYAEGVRVGGRNTAQGVADMLTGQSIEGASYQVQLMMNSTREQIIEGISTVFEGAVETDISLFYINCHGAYEDGVAYLRLHDETRITVTQLERMLTNVPGRIAVILDFCQSGSFIGRGGEFEAFSESAGEAFSGTPLTDDKYIVLASAGADEDSYRRAFLSADGEEATAAIMGRSLCEGAGWDLIYDRSVTLKADADRDRAITMQEIYEYTRRRVTYYLEGTGAVQTVYLYPEGDQTVLFGRN